MSEPSVPKRFGRYEVIGVLGRGSMGVVYKGRDPVIGRLVAIKAIPETLGMETGKKEEYIKRLKREAITAGRLQHPNIVTIFDVGETQEGPFITMEYLDGVTLREIIGAGKKLTLAQLVEITRQVGEGLDYVHERGIVHRDIKPANIMIVEGNLVKIMDLGIARLPLSDLTKEGKLVGSPSYMSPEQLQGLELDGRSDLFSFGVVLYQCALGTKPFVGESIQEICYKIVNDDAPLPSEIDPSLGKEFDRWMAKALAKDREKRFQKGKEMFEELRKIVYEPRAQKGEKDKASVQLSIAEDTLETSLEGSNSNPSLGSSSEIEDIFYDLTHTHRSLKLSEQEQRISTSILAIGVIIIALIVSALIWWFFRG